MSRNASVADRRRSPACRFRFGKPALVGAREQPERDLLLRVGQQRGEAIALHEEGAVRVGQRPHRQVVQVELPEDAGAATRLAARHGEGVVGAVGERSELEERVEAVALQDGAPIRPRPLEGVRPRVEGLFPARTEKLIELGAALGELSIHEDLLLAHLHASKASGQTRRTRDDLGHGLLAPRERGSRSTPGTKAVVGAPGGQPAIGISRAARRDGDDDARRGGRRTAGAAYRPSTFC